MKYWGEFQTKFGFDDGGAVPPDAWACRAAYVRWINCRARELGSDVRLVAYDRGGVHNCYLILCVPASWVKSVPDCELWIGSWRSGWDPNTKAPRELRGAWEEAPTDSAMALAIAEAFEQDLDAEVETKVTLRRRKAKVKK